MATRNTSGGHYQRISDLCAELRDAGYPVLADTARSRPSNIRHFSPSQWREDIERFTRADAEEVAELERLLTALDIKLPRRRPGYAQEAACST